MLLPPSLSKGDGVGLALFIAVSNGLGRVPNCALSGMVQSIQNAMFWVEEEEGRKKTVCNRPKKLFVVFASQFFFYYYSFLLNLKG